MVFVLAKTVAQIQACFPEIYFTCHTHHANAESPYGLTPRDSTLLAHIAGLDGIETGDLARHLGRAKSTLSAALKKLESNNLITVERPPGDARRRRLRITETGRACISQTSVLETNILTEVLASMPQADQQAAAQGLQLLAAACRTHQQQGEN